MSLSFLTPHFFDILVIGAAAVGMVLMLRRLIHDFRQGPLWPDQSKEQPDRSEKP
jgi:hypothetical protein